MKKFFYLFIIVTAIACTHTDKTRKVAQLKDKLFSDHQLEEFLDSIGNLPSHSLVNKQAVFADSLFKSWPKFDTTISAQDFDTLKHAIRKGAISVTTAIRIFKNPKIDASCNIKSISLTYKYGLTPIEYYPFGKDKNAVDQYGICIGDPDHCDDACLYFFKGKKIVSKHIFYERFSPGLWHYKDADGRTVVYYIYMLSEGTGVGAFNYFFYKYDGDSLIPVLNELENGNIGNPGAHSSWLQSTIEKTNPLSIKMVYQDEFPDTSKTNFGPEIINDSTVVKFDWDENTKTFKGQYDQSKINKNQILSYYPSTDNILFINSNYKLLKAALLDKVKRKRVLYFLQKIKGVGN